MRTHPREKQFIQIYGNTTYVYLSIQLNTQISRFSN